MRNYWGVLIVLSPAKSLDYETPLATTEYSQPAMLDHSEALITVMRKKSPKEVAKLMSISPALAELNVERYRDWERPFTPHNARPALLAFNGDVYDGMAAPSTFTQTDLVHAQKTLRILSGLYGLLRPLDLMMPYRLEMGTRLKTKRGANLYDYWGDTITDALGVAIADSPGEKVLINLASQEYFGSVRPEKLGADVVTPVFLDRKGSGDPKIISFFAKKARGVMAGWIIRERITSVDALSSFGENGYTFDPVRSNRNRIVFLRSLP